MSETTITHRVEDPSPAERRAAYEELRKKQLPRMFWDPDYYADPKNAAVARSIALPGPGADELTESQFNRLQIAAQGSMIAPGMIDQMIQVMSGSPTVSPGVAAGLAQFAQSAQFSSAQLEEILTLDAEARSADAATTGGRNPDKGSEGEKGGFLSNLAKGIVRPVFALASIPVEAIQGAIRNTVGMLTDPEQQQAYDQEHSGLMGQIFGNPFNNTQPTPIEQTTGGQYLSGLYGGESADLGSGWIPRGDVEARSIAAMRNAAPLVFNDHWTLGRGVGSMFYDDPNSLAYRNLSGVIDLTAAIVMDPTIFIGVGAAAGQSIRAGQSFAEAVRLGREVGESAITREAITISEGTSEALQRASLINRATMDTATGIVRDSANMYTQAQRRGASTYGNQELGSLRTHVDQLNDTLKDAQLDLASARRQAASERPRARGVEGAEEAASFQGEAQEAVDLLTMQLGDDGLDAMMAKVSADSPELPGLFTDSVFVPLKGNRKAGTALPGSDGGADAIVMWNSDQAPRLVSVDDAVDPSLIPVRARKGESDVLGSAAKGRLEEFVTRPNATYGDMIDNYIQAGRQTELLTALRRSDVDGVTDMFRLTGGEGGVWWTSEAARGVRWGETGAWRVYDGTVGSAQERLRSIRSQIRNESAREKTLLARRNAEQILVDNLSDTFVRASDLRTSIADSQVAVTDAIAYSMGVRRQLGGKPLTSHEALKQWLVGPTREFDAAVQARSDRLSLAQGLEPVNRANTALMTLGASEAIRGVRRLVEPFATKSRTAVFDAMVKLTDTPANLGRLQRLTSGKIDPSILRGVLQAKTEDEVLEVIGPAVGVGISRPITSGVINALPMRLNQIAGGRTDRIFTRAIDWLERMGSITPRFGAHINFSDPQGGSESFRNYLNNVPHLDTGFKDELVGDFLSQTTEVGRGRAIQRGFNKLRDELVAVNADRWNFSPDTSALLADRIGHATRTHEGGRAHVMNWWLKKYGNDANMGFMTMDGSVIPFVGPQLEAELVRGGLILPDTADITRAIGRWGKAVQQHPWLGKSLDLMDSGMDFWRSAVLFRFAYTLRNIGEMQFRMFMSGHSAVYNHPLGALAMASAMNKKNNTSRGLFARFAAYNQTATGKVLDVPPPDAGELTENSVGEFVELMSRSGSYHDPRSVRAVEQSHDLIPVGVDQPGFARGWSEKLLDLRASRLARIVAGWDPPEIQPLLQRGLNRDDVVVDWLLNAPGAKSLRTEYQETGTELAEIWSDPVALRNFLFRGKGSIRERVQEYTIGGNADLVEFIRSGVLSRDGLQVFRAAGEGGQRVVDLESAIRPYLDEIPSDTILNMRTVIPREGSQGIGAGVNRVLDWFFDWNGRKENAWAMGPEFAYAYNDAAVQLMPALDAASRQQIFDFVKGAEGRRFMPSETMMKANAAMKMEPGYLNLDDVERVAARQASDHVKNLFYDARQRKQLFHSLRLVMPFAQPFADTLWHWGRLMAARPYMLERFGRLGEALTEPGSSVIYDDFDWIDPFTERQTADPTQGFIYTDPLSGEAKFTFPLIGSVLGAALSPAAGFNVAESMSLTAPVQNLNLAFQGDVDYLPGVGPLVSIPLGQLMPDDWFGAFPDWLRSYAFPYGEPDPASGVFESTFFPSWMRRLTGALYNEDQRAYSYKGVLAYLVSTKEYPGLQSDPSVQQQLIDDSQTGAKILTFIRALGAAILPAAPTQEIYAADQDGRLIGSSYLSAHWQHLVNESGGDFEAATKAFIDSYGMQALSAIVGSSEGDPPISGPGWEFFKKHPEAEGYGEVLGYFFPGDMSLEAYAFQQESGDRERLSIEERTDKVVQFMFNAEKTQLEGRAARESWDVNQMEEAEELLKSRYGGVIPQFTGIDSRTRLDMVRRAVVQFDDLAETRGGQGAKLLFEAYDEFNEMSEFRYGSGMSSLAAEPLRTEFLSEVDDIVNTYGGQNLTEGSVENIARLFVNAVEPRGS